MNATKNTTSPQARLALARALTRLRDLKQRLVEKTNAPIAVVGAAGRFPGAPDLNRFWELCARGECAISEIPASRFDTEGVPPRAGLLERVDEFDHVFFGMSPAEARMMDPQHRLLLEISRDALDYAFISPARHAEATGMFVGIMNSDYREFALQEADTYTGTGNTACFSAGRISHLLGFHGPSICLDTACSSSLVTVHLACQSLRSREVDLALAGGSSLILSRSVMELTARTGALSATGHSTIFDARANGYVRGEGCAVVVLKRLEDALRDGNRILALIRGSAVNHDGRSSTLTAPSPELQERVVRSALDNAGIRAEDVGYVEAHGTGTSIGDPIELDGLARVLSMAGGCHERCYIGSGKANVGHLEAAAGVTGLLRAIGVLQNKVIFPQANFETLNPGISLRGSTLEIPREPKTWSSKSPRIAGVSAFGMSGTNAHVVLEEAPEITQKPLSRGLYDELLAISAHNREALESLAATWSTLVQEHGRLACGKAAASRPSMPWRVVVRPDERVHDALQRLESPAMQDPEVVFAFGERVTCDEDTRKALCEQSAAFQRCFEDARGVILRQCDVDILEAKRTAVFLRGLALQLAMVQHVRALSVRPVKVIGVGEGALAAGIVAGAWSLEEACDSAMKLQARYTLELPGLGAKERAFATVQTVEEAEVLLVGADLVVGLGFSGQETALEFLGTHEQRLESVATLFERGAISSWEGVVEHDVSCVSPPSYPWQRHSHWVGEPPRPLDARDWCYRLAWEACTLDFSKSALKTVLLFGDQGAETALVERRLSDVASHVVVVRSGDCLDLDLARGKACIRARSHGDLMALVRRVVGAYGDPIEKVLVLPSFGQRNTTDRHQLIPGLARISDSLDCPQWFVTRGAVEPGREEEASIEAPLWGLARAHFFESGVVGGIIDLDEAIREDNLAWLKAVVGCTERPAQLRMKRGVLTQAVLAEDRPPERGLLRCSHDGTYLVTGGTGGIGRRFVDWLIQRGARTVVVTSRRSPSEESDAWIRKAAEVGADIRWMRADAGDREQMQAVFDRLEAQGERLCGVAHAAGVGSQVPVCELDEKEYARVTRGKVGGAWNLHHLTRGMELDFFLAFSSISSVLAGRGQAAYSAANNGLDALMEYRRGCGLVGTSVRWGLWDGEGIPDEEERRRIEGLGLTAMEGEKALDLLDALLFSDVAAPVVASIRWKTCLRFLDPGGADPMFSRVRPCVAPATQKSPDTVVHASQDEVRKTILTHIARHLDLNPASVPLDRPLVHTGLDSLGAYALKGSLQDAGLTIPMELFLDGSTVEDLIQAAIASTSTGSAPELAQMASSERVSMPEVVLEAQKSPIRRSSSLSLPGGVDRGWFVRQNACSEPRMRLICFPYAGGSPSVFSGWAHSLPPEIELRSVQLPARSARLREKPVHRMDELVESLLRAYSELDPLPTAFFGHCFGALMMFELTQKLREEGMTLPTHLFVSGARSPQSYTEAQLVADVEQFSPKPPLQLPQLDDDTLVDALIEMRFADTVEALKETELRRLLLPAVRADFEMSNHYFYKSTAPLPVPIFAMGGRADGYVTALQLLSWQAHTTEGFAHEYCSGGHYFIADNEERWTSRIVSRMLGKHEDRHD